MRPGNRAAAAPTPKLGKVMIFLPPWTETPGTRVADRAISRAAAPG